MSLLWFIPINTIYAQIEDTASIELFQPVIKTSDSSISTLSDTITLRFNLIKDKNKENEKRMLFIDESDSVNIEVVEFVDSEPDILPITYIPNSLKKLKVDTTKGSIPSDITISLLVDHSGSIGDEEYDKIKQAILAFVEKVPTGSLYYSSFSNDISQSVVLTKENFDSVTKRSTRTNTALYNAIYTKLLEFDIDALVPNQDNEKQYKRNLNLSNRKKANNYLIVLTDGVNDVINIGKYRDKDWENINSSKLLKALKKYSNKVKVFALGFGENSDDFDEEDLKRICIASGNPRGYYLVKPESIIKYFKVDLSNAITPDYEIKLINQSGKTYQGKDRILNLEISCPNNQDIQIATGSVEYSKGFIANPSRVGKQSIWEIIPIGLIVGVILFLVIVIAMQLIIPLIKNKIFYIRFAKKYKPAENEVHKECPYCGDPLNQGDVVITKCEHIVHKICWNDFDHVCPEYGQNCNMGKQEFFDRTDPFSKKNRRYYVIWVLFGLVGGLLSWFIYLLLKDTETIFEFVNNIVRSIKPELKDQNKLEQFTTKVASLILIGSTMGFFLTFFFSLIEDYRRKSFKVFTSIFIRGIIGAVLGFLSFLLGGIILVLLNQPNTTLYFDWIPWILFGSIIGLLMSVRTTIVWKHGLLGGIISIVFSFFILYLMAGDIDYYALLIAFMLFGGGLGISIATVHLRAENYYLKIVQGKKNEETIPVHKWMSYQGGHNEVYIGRSFSCEIQMNWESKNPEIAEKHAKMFINNSNMPVIMTLDQEKITVYNDRFDMHISKEYELYSGVKFKIGNTVFQYFEKEKGN
jgi:hypothetical protein